MSVTVAASGNQVTQWKKEFIQEYVREAQFARFSGTSENDIIQIYKDLTNKDGKILSIPLVGKITGSGVSGDNTLEGNEFPLANYSHDVNIEQVRQAVLIGKMAQKSVAIDFLKAARVGLKLWIMDDDRDDIVQAFSSPNNDGVTSYASSSETQKDAWLVTNNISVADSRVMFGALQSNSSLDHSADMTKVDATDKLDYDKVQHLKRLAMRKRAAGGTRNIRPVRVKGGRESHVLFIPSFTFRDLKIDTETIHKDGHVRGKENPLFADPDLLLDGTICVEVPEFLVIEDVGDAGTVDVGISAFCGAQTLGHAVAQMPQFVVKRDFDYNNKNGVSIGNVKGIEKLSHNNVQNGMITSYDAAQPDT